MLVLNYIHSTKKIALLSIFLLLSAISFSNSLNNTNIDTLKYKTFKGKVIDSKTRKPLIFASLSVLNSNISTITNSQGHYQIKIPNNYLSGNLKVSFLGYTSEIVKINELQKHNATIRLETYIEELEEIKITLKDAQSLVKKMLEKKGDNYLAFPTKMTAFYRETIQKRRAYASIAEAIVTVNKAAYTSGRNDILQLYKSRKKTDYSKLDTIAFKLKGGPISNISIDLIKNSYALLSDDVFDWYNFTFAKSTKIDNQPVYVVNFRQKPFVKEPLYYGKLYISSKSFALIKATFQIDLTNKLKASRLFIVKKPRNAKVTPIETYYETNYHEKNGKWYFYYSRIALGFKINWDKKWFNTIYRTTSEMAITNWKKNVDKQFIKPRERIRSSIIMTDEASGFKDPDFWGAYNVIEPEKPIETAIKKIRKQLKKIN
ncbi:MAG: carboxypeptidase-like regulatory domain-containing protein [Lutibacter sp.]